MKVSVIIPTFNRSESLIRTVESFANQKDFKNYEIIVSDNNSSDNTKEKVLEYIENNPHLKIKYYFELNQGVHYARNSAAKLAEGEILYFTDDDMEADPYLLSELIPLFDKEPRLGSATGFISPIFEVNPPNWVKKNLLNQYLAVTKLDLPWVYLISKKEEPIGVYSNHQAIRRKAFFESCGFNPENTKGIWIGDGETGLVNDLEAKNWLFGYTLKSKIFHHIPKERLKRKYIFKRMTNQANSDSYSEYRKHKKTSNLIINLITRNIFAVVKLFFHFIRAIFRIRSFTIFVGRIFYYHSRNLYDLNLIINRKFRKLVEKENWLN